MFKKSFILFSFLFLVLVGLSGCAKQGLFGKKELKYHKFYYYGEHPGQAKKVYHFCNKNYPGWLAKKHINKNCFNAMQAAKPTEFYYGEHLKQAKKVLDFCNKNYPGWDSPKIKIFKKHFNCLDAKEAVAPNWWND